MKNIINWKLFFILLVACVGSSMLIIPYSLALTSSEIKITVFILLAQVLQSSVMFALVVFLGLLLSKKIGMGAPLLQNILEGKNQSKEFKSIVVPSIALGILAGALILLFNFPFTKLIPELQNMELPVIPAWKGFLASFYGGIAEEVLLRLFLVSLLAWITFKIKKDKNGNATVFGIWLSIIVAAIIFGIGHLPATAKIFNLTGLVVARAIVLNGIGGIIFGWLYWKKGLEAAMLSHFSTDIVLHVITPFVTSLFS
ncbi:MAG: CPBP family glutamic-type intramembrane protease [Treponema sp.]|nr:CPBP family glutamic-type intramembrane protease [Treponema sp.]